MQYKMQGLFETNAQAWMAAVGCFSIVSRMGHKAHLLWEHQHPVLLGVDENIVLESLSRYLAEGSSLLEELPKSKTAEKIPLDLTAGRVSFSNVITTMLISVTRDDILNALNLPWMNEDNITSLGWDVGANKMAAKVGGMKAPTSSPHRGVIAGQWLAAEALPVTSLGVRKGFYQWVTWSVPLDISGVWAVVQSKSTEWGGDLYEATIQRNGQMGYLLPARRSH
ncbi:hypothetical protein [Desulfotalea psychrophila]|uniref:hypothetical protein n=1 Tax=Desulfotalea psychrophila TaxID=84980 RepID=UPI0002F2EACE|nr:hypothetical protein [Desulfotalea psychrophila]